MLAEQLAILHGLWTEPDGWSFEGTHWQVNGALRHGPIGRNGRRHPHIILGGRGLPRMADLAARYADEFNLLSASPEGASAAYSRVRSACQAVGRDPDELVYSAMTGVLVAETEADLVARVNDLMAALGNAPEDATSWLAERRARWIMGTPDEAAERVAALGREGAQRVMLQDFLPRDLDHVKLMGRIFAG
jgi:alkanesulfonate monooxygenase SsuD/methylene tetrahydromethanopterin reductase-like flavin-dependent oxidoreductase (luciferase family)